VPPLKRGKDNAVGVEIANIANDSGGTERRHVPAFLPLSAPYPLGADGADATPVTALGKRRQRLCGSHDPCGRGQDRLYQRFRYSRRGRDCGIDRQSDLGRRNLGHADLRLWRCAGVLRSSTSLCISASTRDPRQRGEYGDHRHLSCLGRREFVQLRPRLRILHLRPAWPRSSHD
jgi:hypothetical protein